MINAAETLNVYDRLVLYHRLLDNQPGKAMRRFLTAITTNSSLIESYLNLVRAVYKIEPAGDFARDAWQNYLLGQIMTDENPFTLGSTWDDCPPEIVGAAAHDLRLLQRLFRLTGDTCRAVVGGAGLPAWPVRTTNRTNGSGFLTDHGSAEFREIAEELSNSNDWGALAERIAVFHRRVGAGLVGFFCYLNWNGDSLRGITEPNLFDLDSLVGQEDVKRTVLENTAQFVRGFPANDVLLYGSRGTGKSSTVRGLVSRFGCEGLRLVEIHHSALDALPKLYDVLRRYPQRFVLFLDDPPFDDGDFNYKAFKSAMEGTLEKRPGNVLIYVTSNRRHLIPEYWGERNAPEVAEIHGQDSMEEKLSLADRFGLTVFFTTPDEEEYLAIVEHLARSRELEIDRDQLRELALRWVLWNNPRSGRSARQFVDDLAGRLALKRV